MSASVHLLQRMIDTCCEEAVYLYMKFNALKSNICYGLKCTDLNTELHVDSIAIPCVNRVKYLMSAKSFSLLLQWRRSIGVLGVRIPP